MHQTCNEPPVLNILASEPVSGPMVISQIVQETLARYDWQLGEGAAFAAQVQAEIDRRLAGRRCRPSSAADRRQVTEQAVKYCYTLVLYRACLARGAWQQQRAYHELGRYLFRIAYHKFLGRPDAYELAEECTQEALKQICCKIGDCRDPGSFLAWCIQIVVNQVGQIYRAWYRETPQADGVSEETKGITGVDGLLQPGEDKSAAPGSASPPNGAQVVLRQELTDILVAAVQTRLRSKTQQQVLLLGFIADLDDQQIAERLGTTPSNVHTLRCRALKRLREDPELIAMLKAYVQDG